MNVEVMYFSTMVKNGALTLVPRTPPKLDSIRPGEWGRIELGKETRIAVFCSSDMQKGKVMINDQKEEVCVFLREKVEDKEIEMSKDRPIEIVGKQQLTISTPIPGEVALVLLNRDVQDLKDNFKSVIEDELADPPPFVDLN